VIDLLANDANRSDEIYNKINKEIHDIYHESNNGIGEVMRIRVIRRLGALFGW
jgi:hypothetical protein